MAITVLVAKGKVRASAGIVRRKGERGQPGFAGRPGDAYVLMRMAPSPLRSVMLVTTGPSVPLACNTR